MVRPKTVALARGVYRAGTRWTLDGQPGTAFTQAEPAAAASTSALGLSGAGPADEPPEDVGVGDGLVGAAPSNSIEYEALTPSTAEAEQKLRRKLSKKLAKSQKKAKAGVSEAEPVTQQEADQAKEKKLRRKLEKKLKELRKLEKSEKKAKKKEKGPKEKKKNKEKSDRLNEERKEKKRKAVQSVVSVSSVVNRAPTPPPPYGYYDKNLEFSEKYRHYPREYGDEPASSSNYSTQPRSHVQVAYREDTHYDREWDRGKRPGDREQRPLQRPDGPRGSTYYPGQGRPSSSRSQHDCRDGTVGPPPEKRRQMPEHLQWLHERWRRYDSSFFATSNRPIETIEAESLRDIHWPTVHADRDARMRHIEASRKENWKRQRMGATGSNNQPLGGENRSLERYLTDDDRDDVTRRNDYTLYERGYLLSYKEFLIAQPEELKGDGRSTDMYNEYKLEYRRRVMGRFFQEHSDQEWFLEKYHPMLKQEVDNRRRQKVGRRLDAFMQLLVRGWMEVPLDWDHSRAVRKLIDALIVLLEGGDEGDVAMLDDLDYVLEEKKEESTVQDDAEEASDEEAEGDTATEHNTQDGPQCSAEGKAPGVTGRTRQEQELDEQLHSLGLVTADSVNMVTATDLEAMQHARDYSLYIEQHQQHGKDVSDLPDDLPEQAAGDEPAPVQTKTIHAGTGVFLTQMSTRKNLSEMNLHRTSSLLIRNIAPEATRSEIEELCQDAHGGFLRLHMMEPDPTAGWKRQAVATFWHNANLTKITWKLRGVQVRESGLVVIEWREFTRRIALCDGLAADKSVVLRDVQLCKSLVEHLDTRRRLWGATDLELEEGQEQQASDVQAVSQSNPLLINLDECLAYHLHELLSGTKPKPTAAAAKQQALVDSDSKLTRVLDRLILYLRVVHSVDFYGCHWYEHEDDQPRRIGTLTLRGKPAKAATPNRLAKYIRKFETSLKNLLPQERRLADEHVEVLGKRKTEVEVAKFIDKNIISVMDGMSKCCLCYKRFTTIDYARMHVDEKHNDKIEEVKWIVLSFNNFVADPARPCNVDLNIKPADATTK